MPGVYHEKFERGNGARDRSRTYDLPIRNRLLYPTELPVHGFCVINFASKGSLRASRPLIPGD